MTGAKIFDATLAKKSSLNDTANDTCITESTSVTAQKEGDIDVEKKDKREEDESQYPSTKIVAIVMLALYLAMYLVALDRTIISTAVPTITDEFNSLGDVGWYGSAYLLTACSLQLQFGRIFTLYHTKYVFLAAIGTFEVGSAICGAAPNSTAFIIGRAIAGAGNAGVFSGVIVIMIPLLPLRKRPAYQATLGAIWGISSITGPLIGGALAHNISWRWCFYINLPIGAVAVLIIIFFVDIPSPEGAATTRMEKVKQLDPLGNLVFLPAMVCLLLAIQWGGSKYNWSDGRIVALLVLFGVLIVTWFWTQIHAKENATLPLHILRQRSVAAGAFYSFCLGAVMMVWIYFLPIYFQAIFGSSAIRSGIQMLPLVVSLVAGNISAGSLVTAIGYYTPFLILSSCLMSIGAGLCSTFGVHTGAPYWIGYQIIVGWGIGCGMQQSSTAAQRVLDKHNAPIGVSLMFFGQSLGGVISLSAAQNVLSNNLISNLRSFPNIDPRTIIEMGATALRSNFSPSDLPEVLIAYNKTIIQTYYIALGISCASIIAGLSMEWRSVKGMERGKASLFSRLSRRSASRAQEP
ncbi:MAG: hypothetical protein L6R38_006318 [Xanthoria sp. 2 TBL-2021]|nr:MAG: hypothetical protein L6R38_006318 [Xanthoria sp. 2 TBL-2021]